MSDVLVCGALRASQGPVHSPGMADEKEEGGAVEAA